MAAMDAAATEPRSIHEHRGVDGEVDDELLEEELLVEEVSIDGMCGVY
jgi:mycofactocin precursor